MTSDSNKLKIKIHYENDIRIMTMNSNEINFDETIKYITNNLKLDSTIRLHYVDKDNEIIIIGSTDELKEYVLDKTISTYRIHVTLTTGKKTIDTKTTDTKTTDTKTIDTKTTDTKTIDTQTTDTKMTDTKTTDTQTTDTQTTDTKTTDTKTTDTKITNTKEETIIIKKHMDNKNIISEILYGVNTDFSKLLEYSHFHLDELFKVACSGIYHYKIRVLSEQKNIVIFKHIIDNCVNLECEIINGSRLIHFICQYSTPEIIKYVIDKNVNLECESDCKWRPIHYVCEYSTPEIIKYLVDKNVNLECETSGGWKPIHAVSYYSTFNIIIYMMNKNIILDSKIKSFDGKPSDMNIFDLMKLNPKIKDMLVI